MFCAPVLRALLTSTLLVQPPSVGWYQLEPAGSSGDEGEQPQDDEDSQEPDAVDEPDDSDDSDDWAQSDASDDDSASDNAGDSDNTPIPDSGAMPDGGDISDDGGEDFVEGPRFRGDVEIIDDTSEPEPAPKTRRPANARFADDPDPAAKQRAAQRRADASQGNFGGYFDRADEPDSEPNDGERNVLVGAILLPLGSLQLGGGVLLAVLGMQPRCGNQFGYDDNTCQGMVGYGATSASLGGLMAITGVVFLAIGLGQRGRHRKWQRERGQARGLHLRPGAGGLVLRF